MHREISGSFTAYKVIETSDNVVAQLNDRRNIWSFMVFVSSYFSSLNLCNFVLPIPEGIAGS